MAKNANDYQFRQPTITENVPNSSLFKSCPHPPLHQTAPENHNTLRVESSHIAGLEHEVIDRFNTLLYSSHLHSRNSNSNFEDRARMKLGNASWVR